mmetsp:Transcript_37523/g.99016  ORF Transcript_37523/g.99016 Transcript_37523/m.99016 type:complete len:354 (-) Transcript_37523:113-1174(-)
MSTVLSDFQDLFDILICVATHLLHVVKVWNSALHLVVPPAAVLVAHAVVHEDDTDPETVPHNALAALFVVVPVDFVFHHVALEAVVLPQADWKRVPILRRADLLPKLGYDVSQIHTQPLPQLHRVHNGLSTLLQSLRVHTLEFRAVQQLPVFVVLAEDLQCLTRLLGAKNNRNLVLLVVNICQFVGQLLDVDPELREPRLLLGGELREVLRPRSSDIASVVVHVDIAVALCVQEPVPLPLFVCIGVDALVVPVVFVFASALFIQQQIGKCLLNEMVREISTNTPGSQCFVPLLLLRSLGVHEDVLPQVTGIEGLLRPPPGCRDLVAVRIVLGGRSLGLLGSCRGRRSSSALGR